MDDYFKLNNLSEGLSEIHQTVIFFFIIFKGLKCSRIVTLSFFFSYRLA